MIKRFKTKHSFLKLCLTAGISFRWIRKIPLRLI